MLLQLFIYNGLNISTDEFIISLAYLKWINNDTVDIVINNSWLYQRKNVQYRLKETGLDDPYQMFQSTEQDSDSKNLYSHHMKQINWDIKWSNQDIVINNQCWIFWLTQLTESDDQYQIFWFTQEEIDSNNPSHDPTSDIYYTTTQLGGHAQINSKDDPKLLFFDCASNFDPDFDPVPEPSPVPTSEPSSFQPSAFIDKILLGHLWKEFKVPLLDENGEPQLDDDGEPITIITKDKEKGKESILLWPRQSQ